MVGDIVRGLLALLAPEQRAAAAVTLEASIQSGVESAQQRWPDAPGPDEAFASYVLDRARDQAELATVLPRLRVDDLLLAWWAGSNESHAISAFEATHGTAIQQLVQRFHRLDPDELRQLLRIKLFVGGATSPPRIRDYSGFGFLENWLKVIAFRTFLDAARTRGREPIEDVEDLLELPASGSDPRDAAARVQMVAAVKAALEIAIAELGARERTFLRHVMVDGLTLDQIAVTYQVHRVTVARALASGRKRLYDTTRALVSGELGVSSAGLASMLQVLDSQIHLSLQRLFPEPTL